MTLGERVKRRRTELGLTQQQVATAARVPQSLVAALESGKRSEVRSSALRRLARALGVTADWLIGMYEDEDEVLVSPIVGARKR
jgi:transcriptional regulator with XRE-family HTH domain